MDPMSRASTTREFREIDPSIEWLEEEDCNITCVHVPGFRKDQLRVQLTRTRNLIISGERQVEGNIWTNFRKEFPVPANCDANKISAKFEGGTLFVKHPKLIIPTDQDDNNNNNNNKDKPTYSTEVPQPPQKNGNEKSTDSKNAFQKSPEKEEEKEEEKGVDRKSVAEKTPKEERRSDEMGEEDGKMTRNKKEKGESNATKVDNSAKNRVENYRQNGGVVARELKMSKRVMNLGLAILIAFVLGLYVTNSIRSWKKAEN